MAKTNKPKKVTAKAAGKRVAWLGPVVRSAADIAKHGAKKGTQKAAKKAVKDEKRAKSAKILGTKKMQNIKKIAKHKRHKKQELNKDRDSLFRYDRKDETRRGPKSTRSKGDNRFAIGYKKQKASFSKLQGKIKRGVEKDGINDVEHMSNKQRNRVWKLNNMENQISGAHKVRLARKTGKQNKTSEMLKDRKMEIKSAKKQDGAMNRISNLKKARKFGNKKSAKNIIRKIRKSGDEHSYATDRLKRIKRFSREENKANYGKGKARKAANRAKNKKK